MRRAESQGRCVCGKANRFVSRFQKMLRIAAYPLLAIFRFNRRFTGRGVQRTRTMYYGDLSIEICLDCDASFGFDIDMGSWGYWNLIESIGFGMRKGVKRKALKMVSRFKERMSSRVLESRSCSTPGVSSAVRGRNSNA